MIPFVTLLLAVFLTRTRTGQAIRAAAEPSAARSPACDRSGCQPSSGRWPEPSPCGPRSLIVPLLGLSAGTQIGDVLGPSLLVRALAAVLIARMVSPPITLLGGVVIGIVEALLLANVDPTSSGFMNSPGVVDLLLFVFIVVALLFVAPRRRW